MSTEKPAPEQTSSSSRNRPAARRAGPNMWFLALLILVLLGVLYLSQARQRSTITYDFFRDQIEKDNIQAVELA